MRLQNHEPVEPHWPYGTVAYFYITESPAGKTITTRELVVEEVTEIEDGYRVIAGPMDHQHSPDAETYVFEVDQDGESAQCVPWDDELETQYHPEPQGVIHNGRH